MKGGYHYESVDFVSSDGTKLHGWFFPAREELNPDGKAKGTFVQFHGNAQNMTAHFASMFWVIGAGYNFFTFDYRGYGSSEGEPSQEGLYKDALAAVDYIEKRVPPADGKNPDIILYGQSLGTAVLMRAYPDVPAEEKARVKLVVAEGSFYSYEALARDILSRSWVTFLFQPLGYVLMSDAYSPEDYIAKISPTPFLVIHGDHDQTVPYRFGQKVFELAKEPKTFWTIWKGGHIDSMMRFHGKYRARLIDFIEGRPVPPDDADPANQPAPTATPAPTPAPSVSSPQK